MAAKFLGLVVLILHYVIMKLINAHTCTYTHSHTHMHTHTHTHAHTHSHTCTHAQSHENLASLYSSYMDLSQQFNEPSKHTILSPRLFVSKNKTVTTGMYTSHNVSNS